MREVAAKYFGSLTFRDESVYEFPCGVPAFEDEKQFVLIELPQHTPLVFLQSLAAVTTLFAWPRCRASCSSSRTTSGPALEYQRRASILSRRRHSSGM